MTGFFIMDTSEAFIRYLLSEKNYSPHTILNYRSDLQEYVDFIQKEFQQAPEEVMYAQVRNWIIHLLEKGLANRSINRKISSLRAYYKFLVKIKQVSVSPLAHHKALKIPKTVQTNFSTEEINQMLDDFTHLDTFEGVRNKLIISLFYTTGIRRSELINIKLHDLDLTSRKLVVTGKGNKQRIIPLIDNLAEDIEKYLSVRSELPQIQEDYFFITKKGLKMYDVLVYRIINSYFSMVTSKDKKSPHVLRHSFATHLLDEGANLNAIKDLLGHSSLAATQVYTHSSMAALKNVHKNAHPRGDKK